MTRSTCAWCHVHASLLEQPLGRTGCCSIDCAAKLAGRMAADRLESELVNVGDAQDRRRAFAWVVPLVLAIVVAVILLLAGCPSPAPTTCAPCPDPAVDWTGRILGALTGAAVLGVVLEVRRWVLDHLWWGGGGGKGGGL